MNSDERIETGKYYYTEKKKTSAEVETHLVLPGETLWSISQKYGVRLASLKSKNRIRKDADLKVGMLLNLREPRKRGEDIPIIPIAQPVQQTKTVITTTVPEQRVPEPQPEKPSIKQPERVTHTVAQGETLFAISRKYGVSVENLKSWNSIGSQNIISVGQKLVILKP